MAQVLSQQEVDALLNACNDFPWCSFEERSKQVIPFFCLVGARQKYIKDQNYQMEHLYRDSAFHYLTKNPRTFLIYDLGKFIINFYSKKQATILPSTLEEFFREGHPYSYKEIDKGFPTIINFLQKINLDKTIDPEQVLINSLLFQEHYKQCPNQILLSERDRLRNNLNNLELSLSITTDRDQIAEKERILNNLKTKVNKIDHELSLRDEPEAKLGSLL